MLRSMKTLVGALCLFASAFSFSAFSSSMINAAAIGLLPGDGKGAGSEYDEFAPGSGAGHGGQGGRSNHH